MSRVDLDAGRVAVGAKFGELTVSGVVTATRCLVVCACGKQRTVKVSDLLRTHITSCGHRRHGGERLAPSPRKRAEKLVTVSHLGGRWVRVGRWAVGGEQKRSVAEADVDILRRILAREFRRAADARVRRVLRRVVNGIMAQCDKCTTQNCRSCVGMRDAAIIVQSAAPKPKRARRAE